MLIATAGHVDHGKTLLVRSLTGVDTDRLPEEKKRGLTIELGFAYLSLEDGRVLGFVDVPGHERFVRNMIAGVPAIDFALLVVAADDGPMPQTREHLAILDLLGVSRGAVVVSKTDRADAGRVAEVSGQVQALARDSVLDGAPVFPLSAMTGDGVPALRRHLEQASSSLSRRDAGGGFRFAVDRSFSVHGSGLVVTGAVYAGRAALGDRLRLAGSELELRVRGIESAGAGVEEARAGMRCALNLAGRGVDAQSVARGAWVVSAAAGGLTARMDVRLKLLHSEERALRQWTPVHVHHGAAFVTGRVTLPAGVPVEPGASAPAQLVLDRPLAAVHGDRVVLRDTSGQRTVGGARIIDVNAPRRVRDRKARLSLLSALESVDPATALSGALEHAEEGVALDDFAAGRNLLPGRMSALVADSGGVRVPAPDGDRLLLPARWTVLRDSLLNALEQHHQEHPSEVGPRESALVAAVARGPAAGIAQAAVASLAREGLLTRDGISLRLPGHRARLGPEDQALWHRVCAHIDADTLKPQTSGDLAKTLDIDRGELLRFLEASARRGQLIRVTPNRFYHPAALARLATAAEALSREHGEKGFDARSYRDATGIGRNLTIDVLEFFDVMGLTRRTGEVRSAVRSTEEIFGSE